MRLASYTTPKGATVGVKTAQGFVDVNDIDPKLPRDMTALLAHGLPHDLAAQAEAKSAAAHDVSDADLLPVVPKPGKVICLGLNYVEHAREGDMEIPTYPVVFLRSVTSLLPPGSPCKMSSLSTDFDYEAELGVIIGKGGYQISEDDALNHIAGYTVFNDLSYRDYQFKSPQWTMGKNFDGTGPLGPEMVTSDELPAGAHGLSIKLRLNGETVQDGNTADMIFPMVRTIAELSAVMTLEPGDVIVTGTPAGVGAGRKPPLWLKRGDTCEVEIEGIGVLTTPII